MSLRLSINKAVLFTEQTNTVKPQLTEIKRGQPFWTKNLLVHPLTSKILKSYITKMDV